jgi:phage protein U
VIGVLGPIVFAVSATMVRTFRDLRRSGSARWAQHEVYGAKPRQEFLGPGLETVSCSVRLDAAMGIVPKDELKQLRAMRDTGAVSQLTIGGELFGDFALRGLEEEQRIFDSDGKLLVATVGLMLEEYQ